MKAMQSKEHIGFADRVVKDLLQSSAAFLAASEKYEQESKNALSLNQLPSKFKVGQWVKIISGQWIGFRFQIHAIRSVEECLKCVSEPAIYGIRINFIMLWYTESELKHSRGKSS